MNIISRKILSIQYEYFKYNSTFNREHIISVNCDGRLSYDGNLIIIKPNSVIYLPKNKRIFIFLYQKSTRKIEVILHKHKLVSSNSSSRLIANYIEATNKIKRIKLDNDELILKSLSFYITDAINKNKDLALSDGIQRKNKQTSIKNKVESLVNSDIKNKWNVGNISSSLFMSKSKLYRLLKLDNTCLSSFVLDIRLKNAKNLLLSTDLTISEIAISSGFNSSSYFCKRFKENFYCSPSDFRTISKKIRTKQTL